MTSQERAGQVELVMYRPALPILTAILKTRTPLLLHFFAAAAAAWGGWVVSGAGKGTGCAPKQGQACFFFFSSALCGRQRLRSADCTYKRWRYVPSLPSFPTSCRLLLVCARKKVNLHKTNSKFRFLPPLNTRWPCVALSRRDETRRDERLDERKYTTHELMGRPENRKWGLQDLGADY